MQGDNYDFCPKNLSFVFSRCTKRSIGGVTDGVMDVEPAGGAAEERRVSASTPAPLAAASLLHCRSDLI